MLSTQHNALIIVGAQEVVVLVVLFLNNFLFFITI